MSAKTELIESILNKGKSYALDTMKSIGNPMEAINSGSASLMQRLGAGAVGGATLGAGINLATGVLGAPISAVTGGRVSDDLSVGSLMGSGMRGAIAGMAVAGGGFKNVNGSLQMRSGMRSVANTIGDIAGNLGIGLKEGSELGQKAVRGGFGNGMLDQFAQSMRYVGEGGLSGSRVGAQNIASKINNMTQDSSRVISDFTSRWKPNEFGRVDSHLAKQHKNKLSSDMFGKKTNLNSEQRGQLNSAYTSLKEEERAAFNKANAYQNASYSSKINLVGGDAQLVSNNPIDLPSLTSIGKSTYNSFKKDKFGGAIKGVGVGSLAMSMYQTNALGISLPSNRGYR